MRCTFESHRAGPRDRAAISIKRTRSQAETLLFPIETGAIQHKCKISYEMDTAKPEPETHYIHAGVSARVQQGTIHTDYQFNTDFLYTRAKIKFRTNSMHNNNHHQETV